MKLNVDPLLEAIERYIAKTDDDLEEQLNEEGYVEAGVAVAHMGTIEDGVTAAVENNVDEVLARLQSASGVDDFIETVWPEISNSDEMEKALHDLFYQQCDELLRRHAFLQEHEGEEGANCRIERRDDGSIAGTDIVDGYHVAGHADRPAQKRPQNDRLAAARFKRR